MERKVDSYAGSQPKSPIAQCVHPPSGSSGWSARLIATPARRPSPLTPSAFAPIRLVRMERKVDSYAGLPPTTPIAQCVLPIRLVRMERKIDSYRRPLPKSPIA